MDFAVPVDHRDKKKESEKRDKNEDPVRNWKSMEYEIGNDTKYD